MPGTTPVAGVVLKNQQGRYLLVQEAKKRVYGLWNWPAGKGDSGETLQETAIREAKEETNLDVKITDSEPFYRGQYIDIDMSINHATHLFHAEILGGKLRHQDGELLDVRWFSPAEIRQLIEAGKTRGEWVGAVLDMIEAGKA